MLRVTSPCRIITTFTGVTQGNSPKLKNGKLHIEKFTTPKIYYEEIGTLFTINRKRISILQT